MPKASGTNEDTYTETICTGDSIEFRIIIENYQNAALGIFDASGRYGSYCKSPLFGIIAWENISGLGALNDDLLILQSNKEVLFDNSTNTYILQWSDNKNGLGSFSSTSMDECYERMNFTLTKNQEIDSAIVSCVDAINGISSTVVYPSNSEFYGSDLTFELYDDIGDQSNMITGNETGLFSLTLSDVASVGYYVIVRNDCNEVTAINNGAFCMADPLCPQIDLSSFLKNEDFEGASNVGYATSGVFSDGLNDYFNLIGELTDPTGVPLYTGANGGQYWAGEDTQDGGNPICQGFLL